MYVCVAMCVEPCPRAVRPVVCAEPVMWTDWVSLRIVEDGEPEDIACVARALGVIFPCGVLASHVVVRESARVNAHSRDCMVKLEEVGHRYLYKPGCPDESVFPISVSGLWARYFEQFDGASAVAAYFGGWASRPGSKYYGMIAGLRHSGMDDVAIQERIVRLWSNRGLLASTQGTRMHRNIELALGRQEYDGTGPEMGEFHQYVRDWLEQRRWVVYRLEWSIFCSYSMVAGQIDAVFQGPDGYHMVDWKRCREPLDPCAGAAYGRAGRPPFEDLGDNKCVHYFVQQNLYAAILERWYGIVLVSMSLVQIHPELPGYRVIPVPLLRERVWRVLNEYALSRERALV